MATNSNIEWTDHTVNGWWGCTKVSPGCSHCYAETLDARGLVGGGGHWGPSADRFIRVDKAIAELDKHARASDREGRPHRVFLHSMSDFFEDRADLVEPRKRMWGALQRIGPRLQPLVLTKRPDVAVDWIARHGWIDGPAMLGISVEDQQRADERIPVALEACVPLFLSMEPLLGEVDLTKTSATERGMAGTLDDWPIRLWDCRECAGTGYFQMEPFVISCPVCYGAQVPGARGGGVGVSWVIVGGESGRKARPMHPDWVRSIRNQCEAAGVPFFFKQWGEWGDPDSIEYTGLHSGYSEQDARDGGVPAHYWPDSPVRAAFSRFGKPQPKPGIAGDTEVYRVGKKAAGRHLDGCTWDELPGGAS